MADYTVEIDLFDHKQGDWWVGITPTGPVTVNGLQPDEPLVLIRCEFRKAGLRPFLLSSDPTEDPDGPITIINPSTWAWEIKRIDNFLTSPGTWSWDMEFYENGADSPLTFYKGEILVYNEVTQNA